MSVSFGSFLVSIILATQFRKYSKANLFPQWVKLFNYILVFSVILFSVSVALPDESITKWIWHVCLVAFIYIAFQKQEFRVFRLFILAFVPYVLVTLVSDLTALINSDFFTTNKSYFDNAKGLTYMWVAALLYSHNRQFKAAEKERIKRKKEDEENRAIALRKVELEGMVVARTAELTEQKEELENTLNELRSTQTQLIQSEKMASLGELTAGIAHEIQNPLNFVNNFSELSSELIDEMKEELIQGRQEEALAIADDLKQNLNKIHQHGKRADATVKGMLQHSRVSSGTKEPTNINALADEYLRLSYHGLRAKDESFKVTIVTDFDKSIEKVHAIPQDIGRVMLNLFSNAFYAVNEKSKLIASEERLLIDPEDITAIQPYEPTLTVSTKKIGNLVEIKVKDNGTGIPKKALDKIFQPFFTTKPTGEGTGLGLSLAYDIVTKGHGGEFKVETEEGNFTEFTVVLPV